MKLLFIPNWNGHLHIAENDDTSIRYLYEKVDFDNKELLEIQKNNIDETNKIIFNRASQIEGFLLSVVGDHSTSYPLIEAYSKKNKDFKLIIFDAHPDTEVSTDAISHEDYLRNLIDNQIIKPQNVYLIGVRAYTDVELNYLKEKKINYITSEQILEDKSKAIEFLEKIETDNIYLSIDIDVLDPSEAPGTYYAEEKGISSDLLIEMIQLIKPKVKSADITEFYREKDKNQTTEKNVLRLIEKLKNDNND